LRLCGLNASVRQVFDVAGFSKLFALFPDRSAALGEVGNVKIKPEVVLAQKAAALLSVKSTSEPPHPKAVDLARIATQLLGLKPMSASAGRAMPASASPRPPVKAASKPKDDAPQDGVLGKIRGIFGGKS
jgi:hypothetical protein